METVPLGSGNKRELDDSGCVQDEPPAKKSNDEYTGSAELLDLSDDVLLFIFSHCSPMDLKALGYSCPRLGALIRDRTLWQRVDARDTQCGRTRLRWLLAHGIGEHTVELQLRGYAQEAMNCMGHVLRTRRDGNEEAKLMDKLAKRDEIDLQRHNQIMNGAQIPVIERVEPDVRISDMDPYMTRFASMPAWCDDPEYPQIDTDPSPDSHRSKCPGPQFTLTQCMLKQIRINCVNMTTMSLEYCNIDCRTTGINQLPSTLKKLSLKGTKCYNLPVDKSFLFKIQDYMPNLEYLDLSECEWLEPASLLPLSKMIKLQQLFMRDCLRLSEFVAYASLATRYGFRQLKVLDMRGSPVGDSEVSALGWLPLLEELYLSPAKDPIQRVGEHSHFRDDAFPAYSELEEWEKQVPEYFKIKQNYISIDRPPESMLDIDEQVQQLRSQEANLCLHGRDYNLCTEGIRYDQPYTGRRNEKCTQVDTPRVRQLNKNTQTIPNYANNYIEEERERVKRKLRRCALINARPFNCVHNFCQTDEAHNMPDNNNVEVQVDNVGVQADNVGVQVDNVGVQVDNVNAEVDNVQGVVDNGQAAVENELAAVDNVQKVDNAEGAVENNEVAVDNGKATVDNNKATVDNAKARALENNKAHDNNGYTNDNVDNDKDDIDNASTSKDSGISTCESSNDTQNSPRVDNNVESKDDNIDDNMPSCSKQPSTSKHSKDDIPGPSKSAPGPSNHKSESPKRRSDDDDSDDDQGDNNRVPKKPRRIIVINEGASTSKQGCVIIENDSNQQNNNEVDNSTGNDQSRPRFEQFIRFRQNEAPVIVQLPMAEGANENGPNMVPIPTLNPVPEANDRPILGRHHVLYVNVGQKIHAVYRMSLENDSAIPRFSVGYRSRSNFRTADFSTIYTPPLDSTSFVTDAAIRRFGRADSDECVQLGQNPVNDPNARPNRSNLRVLHVTGYRNITDRSLFHLITAAPYLQEINFSNTRVTEQGVENFRASRPDCEVVYSPFEEKSLNNDNSNNDM